MPHRKCPVLSTLLALAALLALAPAAPAQDYFGQNKVRYQAFDFKVLKTEHFDIYYYTEEEPTVQEVGRIAERWYARLSLALHHDLSRRQPLILYDSHPAFEQTNAIYGDIGEGVGGVTEFFKRRIVLPMAGPMAETDHVIGHELVHAFQYDIAGQGRSSVLGVSNAARLPLWFMEGMAEYLSVGAEDPLTAMWMRDAVRSKHLPDFRRLEDPRYFPYRYGQSLWAFIAGRYGDDMVGRVLKAAGRSGDVRPTLQATLGVSPDSLIRDWHRALRDWKAPIAAVTDSVPAAARALVFDRTRDQHFNLAPALAPDGRHVMFFSARGLFSIEMYLAELPRGKVIRQVTKTAVDPHFQSLEFIGSAGEWSRDGRRFALGAVSHGRPVLTIIDPFRGRTVKEFRLSELGEVFSPTWSPDGRRIAFSALEKGITNLWVLDVATGERQRLTEDVWADLEPAWSPDGRSLAFVTDRFGAPGEPNRFGSYRLALYDLETRQMHVVPTFEDGKSINPQWTPDGTGLYFVSDHFGISNLYRVRLADGHLEPLTNLLTGVSGITRLSPALTVASDSGQVVFSVYQGGNYDLYAMPSGARLEPRPAPALAHAAELPRGAVPAPDSVTAFRPDSAGARAARPDSGAAGPTTAATVHGVALAGATGATAPALVPRGPFASDPAELPPLPRTRAAWADSARRAAAAVDTMAFRDARYRSRFSLDYIAQPSLGIAVGGSGLAIGGGAGLYWSDMLGNHELATILQFASVGGSILNNTTALVGYQDLRSRWSWGIQGGQLPYITTYSVADEGEYNGQYAQRQRDYRFWQIERTLEGNLSYPISRFQRVELSGGYRGFSFESEVQTRIYDAAGNQLVDETTHGADSLGALHMGTVGAALVYDSAIFGGTSPVLGQRYRFELAQVLGTLNYHSVLADYRRYVRLARPLSVAGRVLHFGRYGPGSDDERLSLLYLGYPYLVRGYDDGSFTGGEATLFNQLFGSRLGVVNAEVRLALLGALGVFQTPGVPPVETLLFYDAGAAWTGAEKADFLGGGSPTVTSYGWAMRINLLGFAVGEVALVHPNDRPLKGWYWEFALKPGF